MDWIALLAYVGVALAIPALFYALGARSNRPIYSDDKRIQSKSLFRLAALVGAIGGLILAVIQSFSLTGLDLVGAATVSLGSMVLFLLVVTAYTDHLYRLADRHLLHGALGLSLIFGIFFLIELQSESITVLYVVAILLSLATMFVPSLGASDSRAFMILFAMGIPVLGVMTTYHVFLVGIVLWLLYGVVFAIRHRSFKVSIPLVPYIFLPLAVAPFWLSFSQGIPRIIEVLNQ